MYQKFNVSLFATIISEDLVNYNSRKVKRKGFSLSHQETWREHFLVFPACIDHTYPSLQTCVSHIISYPWLTLCFFIGCEKHPEGHLLLVLVMEGRRTEMYVCGTEMLKSAGHTEVTVSYWLLFIPYGLPFRLIQC